VIGRRSAAAAGLLIGVAAAGALVVASVDAEAPAGRPQSHSSTTADRGDLLLRVDPPPPRPPAVALRANDPFVPGGYRIRPGVLYRAEWLRDGARWMAAHPARADWGIAFDAPSTAPVTVDLGVASRPSAVTVYGFTAALRGNGEPAGPPQYEVDCDRDELVHATASCELTRAGATLHLSLARLAPGTVHLAVTIAWMETGSTRSGPPVLYDSGTWLFTLTIH
jgi:hypothetical protein